MHVYRDQGWRNYYNVFAFEHYVNIIQPMDQGILEALKGRYKKNILRHLILENESSSLSVPEVVKKITIKDVVYWCAQAWEEAGLDSWRKGWNKDDCSVDIEETSVTSDG